MDPDERRLVVAGQRDAGGAVGLVADHQVELAEPVLVWASATAWIDW